MRTIWKYSLNEEVETLNIPIGYKILSVINQNNVPTLYCLVNPDNETIETEIVTVGTGMIVEDWYEYIEFLGTVATYDGMFVWHVFRI